jgi:hypothetical protein
MVNGFSTRPSMAISQGRMTRFCAVELVGLVRLRRVEIGGRVGFLGFCRFGQRVERYRRRHAKTEALQDGPAVEKNRLRRGKSLCDFPPVTAMN